MLRSLGSRECRILSTEPKEGLLLLAPETKSDASVFLRRYQDYGATGVAAYIMAAWLAAGVRAARERCVEGEELVQK